MGRNSTGAWTTEESTKIELSYLQKSKLINPGSITIGELRWTSGKTISISCNLSGNNSYIRLKYSFTTSKGIKTEYDYCVQLSVVKSNLGSGDIYYFLCPVSGKRCRILYQAYSCPVWKCREAYNNRIYYRTQVVSKLDRYNSRYWQLEEQINDLKAQRRSYSYRGKPTRRAIRLNGMIQQQALMNEMRWSFAALPVSMRKYLQENNFQQPF